jgi:hypothetical protein
MSHDIRLQFAFRNAEEVVSRLALMIARKSYTIKEVQDIRRLLLQSVRHHLDPLLPHMPEERRY